MLRSIARPFGICYPRFLHRRMRTTREMFAHVKSLGSRACGRVLCSPNHTFVSHPMISEHWDERSRRNLEASAPTKARSEPTDRASERLRCPLCVRRTFVFHVPELACTLSAASGVMRGDASYSRRERPFAIILGGLDISVARSTRCVHRLCRALPSRSTRELSRPPALGFFLRKCRKSNAKSAHVHQNAREAARFHRTHHLHIAPRAQAPVTTFDFSCGD